MTDVFIRDPRVCVLRTATGLTLVASYLHCRRQVFQQRFGVFEADAGIGDRDAVTQRLAGREILAAFVDVAFDHHADDAAFAACELAGDIGADVDLARELLARVGMREVDHHALRQA